MNRTCEAYPFLQCFHTHVPKASLPLCSQGFHGCDKGAIRPDFLRADFPFFVPASPRLTRQTKPVANDDFRAVDEACNQGEGVDHATQQESVGVRPHRAGGYHDGETRGKRIDWGSRLKSQRGKIMGAGWGSTMALPPRSYFGHSLALKFVRVVLRVHLYQV